jgi:hypothetical protein
MVEFQTSIIFDNLAMVEIQTSISFGNLAWWRFKQALVLLICQWRFKQALVLAIWHGRDSNKHYFWQSGMVEIHTSIRFGNLAW